MHTSRTIFLRPGLVAAAALVASALAPSAASAAGQPFTCEASVLRGTVLTGPAIEPFVANRGKPCATTQAGIGNLTTALGPALKVSALGAGTTLVGPADRPDQQQAVGSAGVADVSIGSLASLGLNLPLDQIALPPGLAVPPVDITPIATAVNTADVLNAVPDVPNSVTVDIAGAVKALLKLPTTDLLAVKGAVANASASCQNGTPTMIGTRSAVGLSVLGNAIDVNTVGDQPIVDTQTIDPSTIDTSTLSIPIVDALLPSAPGNPGVKAAIDQIRASVAAAVKALPPVAIPISLARVQVTPGTQTKTADSLTQTALGLKITALGQNVVDLTLGEAKVGTAGVQCAVAATAAQTALQCTKRKLVLIDVLQRGRRVAINGVADKRYVGRTVGIRFRATGKTVAHAKVAKNGTFKTTAPLPSSAVRATNSARYQAVLGKEKSLDLKLQRRMMVTRVRSANGKVTITGRVTRPLAAPAQTIRLERRVSCKKNVVVKRFKPRRDGTFSVTVAAPKGMTAAVYRLATKVRKTTRNPKLFPTFTLPRGVDLVQ